MKTLTAVITIAFAILFSLLFLALIAEKEKTQRYEYHINLYRDTVTVYNGNGEYVGSYVSTIDSVPNKMDIILINDNL